ncbi:Small GTPase superfamily, Rab type [Trema orientale]|uniref:Small GTPase superfamily, Rab type n=1 Tax=Trema orientale TaxID=63057 RepID=A0A2P5EEB6_TREOI|nr:Small GTPase superfamily, Rab type [Trema orientale]
MVQFCLRRRIQRRMLILRRCIRRLMDRLLMSCLRKTVRYRMLPQAIMSPTPPAPAPDAVQGEFESVEVVPEPVSVPAPALNRDYSVDSDLVPLKISLLGDCNIGKTSFLEKYVGDEKERGREHENGLSSIDKTLIVGDARISYSIWEVGGDKKYQDHIPIACKDSVAILFMFDLTSRCTLNSVIGWYQQARKWNQTAIPILIGTKFDDFIQLPIDLQWTIASQARSYAKALNATLFFSSATYNINVNKIFKFITAKIFDLPWTVERNLTIGEPIIDF